jgi:hypothetical protein
VPDSGCPTISLCRKRAVSAKDRFDHILDDVIGFVPNPGRPMVYGFSLRIGQSAEIRIDMVMELSPAVGLWDDHRFRLSPVSRAPWGVRSFMPLDGAPWRHAVILDNVEQTRHDSYELAGNPGLVPGH